MMDLADVALCLFPPLDFEEGEIFVWLFSL